jgi:hypothetical protein
MVSAHKTAATRALLDHVERGHTGRIAVGAGAGEISLFLLDGAIVGCRASDDTTGLIDRLGSSGHLPSTRVRQLQAMVSMSLPILGRQTHDPILGLLADEIGPEQFERLLEERFEENVRRFVGHSGTPRFQEGVSPWVENVQLKHDTVELVARCVQDWDMAASFRDSSEYGRGPAAAATDDEAKLHALVENGSRPARELAAALHLEQTAARAAVMRMVTGGVLSPPTTDHHEFGGIAKSAPLGSQSPGLVSDDELDAFSGAEDRSRGGGGQGTFVTEAHNLDRVELEFDISDNTEPSVPVAFSAPTLSEEDALGKIGVANEVLGVVSTAIDSTRSGRGASTIQLLVDGRPRTYTALFEGIRVTSAGGLPSREVLDNLRRRPAPEQRRLLNQGMIDLLDRALDKAADELPETMFDDILDRVMGYRQRLGL